MHIPTKSTIYNRFIRLTNKLTFRIIIKSENALQTVILSLEFNLAGKSKASRAKLKEPNAI
jgi:hypothetical protein